VNHATRRRHELSSMGIRVNVETLKKQLEMSGQTDFLKFLYHQGIIKNEIPRALVEESGRHAS
jgi:aspartate--ammonia ligase